LGVEGWGIVKARASKYKVQHSRFIFGRPTISAILKEKNLFAIMNWKIFVFEYLEMIHGLSLEYHFEVEE